LKSARQVGPRHIGRSGLRGGNPVPALVVVDQEHHPNCTTHWTSDFGSQEPILTASKKIQRAKRRWVNVWKSSIRKPALLDFSHHPPKGTVNESMDGKEEAGACGRLRCSGMLPMIGGGSKSYGSMMDEPLQARLSTPTSPKSKGPPGSHE